jgi:hypothetical protein
MASIPPDIKRHRLPGTEIKRVGGRYYIQRVKCVWVPQTQKRRKIVIEYIGSVTPEGITPKQTRKVPCAAMPHSKEFGASWALRQVSGDIRQRLARHFGANADWIYAAAILRCVHPAAMRYLEHKYAASHLSEALPGLDMRPETLSAKMRALGHNRTAISTFMKEFVPSGGWCAIFNGTPLVRTPKNIREAQRGCDSRGRHDPQINLMYVIALKDDSAAPVFYKRYPGNIRSVSAFRNRVNAMGLSAALVIADKGVTKKSGCERFEKEGITYILPLRRNSVEYSRAPLRQVGRTGFEGRFKYNGRIVWFSEQRPSEQSPHKFCLYLDEGLYHDESASRGTDKIGSESPEQLRRCAEKQLEFGTFALKTNLLDFTPERLYRTCKTREEIEQLYKNEEQFAVTGVRSAETQEACLFLNHLGLVLAYRIFERLKKSMKSKEVAVQKTLELLLKDIRVTRFGDGEWQLEPVPKAARLALDALGLTLPEKSS